MTPSAGGPYERDVDRGPDYRSSTRRALVKFETGIPKTESWYQAWKIQVSPAIAAVGPPGTGIELRSRERSTDPVAPEFATCPL